MKQPNVKITVRTAGGLILPGPNGRHRRAGWYWHRPISNGQVIRLYNYFKDQPEPKK